MMKTVKAAWDKAPAGPKKDAALKHYQAAEAALKAHNEQGCVAALKQAQVALNQAQATERAPPTGRGSLSRSGGAGSVPSGDICGIGVDLVRRQYGGRNGLEPR